MLKRTVTAVVLLCILLVCLWLGKYTSVLLFFCLAWLACGEMADAENKMGLKASALPARIYSLLVALIFLFRSEMLWELCALIVVIAFTLTEGMFKKRPFRDQMASLFICMYPATFLLGMCYVCVQENALMVPVIAITFCAASACDMFAFFGGKLFGKHPLAPHVSPKKTIEGSICGFIFGTAAGLLPWAVLRAMHLSTLPVGVYLLAAFLCALMGQIGDLCASMIKRQAGIKDFSDILPGHGGIIDRMDSYMFALPMAFFIVSVFLKLN